MVETLRPCNDVGVKLDLEMIKFLVFSWQILLCTTLNPIIATGALFLPSSIYAILKVFPLFFSFLQINRQFVKFDCIL